MWIRSTVLHSLEQLDLYLRAPGRDVKLYLLFEDITFYYTEQPTYEEIMDLDPVEVGTWDSAFAGTAGYAPPVGPALNSAYMEGRVVEWENDTEENQSPLLWVVLDHTSEEVRWIRRLSEGIPYVVAPDEKFRFRPQILSWNGSGLG